MHGLAKIGGRDGGEFRIDGQRCLGGFEEFHRDIAKHSLAAGRLLKRLPGLLQHRAGLFVLHALDKRIGLGDGLGTGDPGRLAARVFGQREAFEAQIFEPRKILLVAGLSRLLVQRVELGFERCFDVGGRRFRHVVLAEGLAGAGKRKQHREQGWKNHAIAVSRRDSRDDVHDDDSC